MVDSNKFYQICLIRGRIDFRAIGIATLQIRIANAPKSPAPVPICRAGPHNAAFCRAIRRLLLFIWES